VFIFDISFQRALVLDLLQMTVDGMGQSLIHSFLYLALRMHPNNVREKRALDSSAFSSHTSASLHPCRHRDSMWVLYSAGHSTVCIDRRYD